MTNLIARKLSIRIFWKNIVTEEVESRRLILRKGRMESNLHIILKILAYCYFWDKNLAIEMAKYMSPQAILGGESLSDVFGKMVKGTILEKLPLSKTSDQ